MLGESLLIRTSQFVERHPYIVGAVGVPAAALLAATGITFMTADLESSNPPVLGPELSAITPCDYSEYRGVCMEDWYAGEQLVHELNNRRYAAELSPLRNDEVLTREAALILDVLGDLDVNPTPEEHGYLRGIAREGIVQYRELGEVYSTIDSVSASFDKTQGVGQIPAFDMLFAWQEPALGEMMSSRQIDSIGVAYQDFGEYSIVVAVVANNEAAI